MKSIPLFLLNLPMSFAGRMAMEEEEIRTVATFEQYLKFAEECEYKVEFLNNHIISMSNPTDAHETIVMNIGWALNNLIADEEPYQVYGSNLGIYISENANFRPDILIQNALPEFIVHKVGKKRMKSVRNPFAVVEIFSDSTANYDMTEKLPAYKQCATIQYIVFVHQHQPFVTVFQRSKDDPSEWLNRDHAGLNASFLFEGKKVLLKHIYRKVIFMGGTSATNGKKP